MQWNINQFIQKYFGGINVVSSSCTLIFSLHIDRGQSIRHRVSSSAEFLLWCCIDLKCHSYQTANSKTGNMFTQASNFHVHYGHGWMILDSNLGQADVGPTWGRRYIGLTFIAVVASWYGNALWNTGEIMGDRSFPITSADNADI